LGASADRRPGSRRRGAAAGAAIRKLHDAPLPPRPGQVGRSIAALATELDDVTAGYGTDIDLDVIRAWWSLRSLLIVRWLSEHGFDPFAPGCEVDVLRSRM
jgi:hypothetical protein